MPSSEELLPLPQLLIFLEFTNLDYIVLFDLSNDGSVSSGKTYRYGNTGMVQWGKHSLRIPQAPSSKTCPEYDLFLCECLVLG